MYRLVTDNSLEKKIYDRQVNKQGMADRIVDEMNPDAHLSTRDVHSLICEEEEDTSNGEEVRAAADTFSDPVMRSLVTRHGDKLTKPPFAHESLLVDRKDNKLSRAEKQMAEKAYKLERTSKITYSRPSYAAFYPKQGTFATNLNNPGSNGFTRNRYYEHGRKLDTWTRNRGQSDSQHVEAAFPVPSFSNVLGPAPTALGDSGTNEWKQRGPGTMSQETKVSNIQQLVSTSSMTQVPEDRQSSSGSEKSASGLNTGQALEALSKQGVQLQQVLVPRDLSIPTGPSSAPVHLVAGDKVMVIRTVKGETIGLDFIRTWNLFVIFSRNLFENGRKDHKDQTTPGGSRIIRRKCTVLNPWKPQIVIVVISQKLMSTLNTTFKSGFL